MISNNSPTRASRSVATRGFVATALVFTLGCSGSEPGGSQGNDTPNDGGFAGGGNSTGGAPTGGTAGASTTTGGNAGTTSGVGGDNGGSAGSSGATGGLGGSSGSIVAGGGGVGGTAGTVTAGASGTAGAAGSGAGNGGAGQGGGAAAGQAGGGASGTGGASGKGGAGGSAGKGGAGAGGGGNACPLDLVGFATREGGTTGGGNAAPTTVTTQAALRTCATASGQRVCRVQGTVTFSPFEEIRVTSDKTIIGAGNSAAIVMGGFFLGEGVHNVIIRNLTIRDSYVEGQNEEGGDEGGDRDGVQMDAANHVWIDHCRFSRLGDGLIDSRMDTTFETVSWNILENHDKTFGIGWTENVTAQITIHHNWLRNTNQRNPSTDNVLRAHLFNNVMEALDSYGNYARGGTNMVLQNSVFINVNNPHYYDTGTLVATGNIYRGATGQQESSGTSFSFFDPGTFYSYTLDPASAVEALVERCAGPRAELGN
jgi:pectate lyase